MIPENCKVYISRWDISKSPNGLVPPSGSYRVLSFNDKAVRFSYCIFINFLYILNESEYIEFCLTNVESPIEFLVEDNLNIQLCRGQGSINDVTYNTREEMLEALFKLGCEFKKLEYDE